MALACIIACIAGAFWIRSRLRHRLSHIPSLTTDIPLLSFFGAVRYALNARDVLQNGYSMYRGSTFRVPELFRWHVIVTGRTLVQELQMASDKDLNLREAMADMLHTDYTIGRETHDNPYQDRVLRTFFAHNLDALYPDVHDELNRAIYELIPLNHEWTKIPAFETIAQILCRTSNRTFVGLPLCRDRDFIKLNIEFTAEVMKASSLVSIVPEFLKSYVARFTRIEAMKRRSEQLLRPHVDSQLLFQTQRTRIQETTNTMLSALIDAAPKAEPQAVVSSVALRVLVVNFTAIHTSVMAFVHALYHLAVSPEFQAELRAEVDEVLYMHGWTSEALTHMIKVDSFIKETVRYNGVAATTVTRKALRDFRFSDGTLIPSGTLVSAAARATHFDPENYEDPNMFDPWRFVKLSEALNDADTKGSTNHALIDTSPVFLSFGLGKHACPGRFFASMEMKAFLAKLVYTYDLRMEKAGVIPSPMWLSTFLIPNQSAHVLFRKRK